MPPNGKQSSNRQTHPRRHESLPCAEKLLVASPWTMSDVTRILEAMERGEGQAAEQLLPLVYAELRRLAAHKMANENPGQTLQPTALVHEAWLKLVGQENRRWQDRNHFFAAAAEAMRQILTDHARRKLRQRHGGGQQRVDLDDCVAAATAEDEQVVAVSESLEKFAELDPQRAELVKLRYFVGLTIPEAAEVMGISEGTAKRYWSFARAWLYEEIRGQRP
jgi:RNA polymerase sigma factor (TIGR02999 family)